MSCWRLNSACTLTWQRWDDEWVVFDSGSGDTMQLDPLAAVTLMCLEAEPFSLSDLTAQIAAELDLPVGEPLSAKLGFVLENLTHLGLIERVTE
jgi:PqqD family protein of HPr-rel-A system